MRALHIAAAALLAFAAPAAAQTTTLKYAFVNPMSSHFGTAATAFKDSVEADSGGRIKIDIFPAGALGGEREIVESLQLGAVDMAMTGTSVVGNFVPDVLIYDVPFLFRDTKQARDVLDGAIGKEILAKFADKDLVGLGYGENGFKMLTNNKHPVATPADLNGMTVRVMENEIHIAAFKELGARPTPIAWPELFAALQQGVVDGQDNPISNVVSAKFFQVQKYGSLTRHVFAPTVIMMSPTAWAKLSDADKAIVAKGVEKAVAAQRAAVDEYERTGLAKLKEAGMQIDDTIDPKPFVEKLAPAYVAFAKRFGQERLDAIRAVD
jgi:tripartite ATP-independent transporter DctP family solute receptor